MKRNILLIFFVVSFSALSAQNVIDTICDTARYYYYYQWQGYDNEPVCDTCRTVEGLPYAYRDGLDELYTIGGIPFEQAGRSLEVFFPLINYLEWDSAGHWRGDLLCNGQPGTAEYATRFYTSRPLQIVGLAVGMITRLSSEEETGDEGRLELRIWTPQGDSLCLLDSVTVTHLNLAHRHRVLTTYCPGALGSHYFSHTHNSPWPETFYDDYGYHYVYMYDGYFDKTISVMDTFYIGMKGRVDMSNTGGMVDANSEGTVEGTYEGPNTWFAGAGKMGTPDPMVTLQTEVMRSCHYDIHRVWRECGTGPWRDQKDHWKIYGSSGAYPINMGVSQFLFPIIIPEPFHCPEVQNIHVTSQTATTTIVEWSAHDHHAYYEYVYGVEGSDPDTLPVLYVTDTLTGLFHLDSNVRYQCWVRAVCEVDSTYRSAWSNPITVWMGIFDTINDDDTTGILLASEYDTRIVLSPNPATTRLDIASEVTMQHVEIYNLHGKTFYEQSHPTTHLTVNLDGWPAGGYMVRIQTPDGTVMKKLIVRR